MTKTCEHRDDVSHVCTQVEPAESAGAARESSSVSAQLTHVIVTALSTRSWNK